MLTRVLRIGRSTQHKYSRTIRRRDQRYLNTPVRRVGSQLSGNVRKTQFFSLICFYGHTILDQINPMYRSLHTLIKTISLNRQQMLQRLGQMYGQRRVETCDYHGLCYEFSYGASYLRNGLSSYEAIKRIMWMHRVIWTPHLRD